MNENDANDAVPNLMISLFQPPKGAPLWHRAGAGGFEAKVFFIWNFLPLPNYVITLENTVSVNIANIDQDDQDHDHVCWFSGENLNVEWNARPFSMSSPVLLEIFIWWKCCIALVALKNIFHLGHFDCGMQPEAFFNVRSSHSRSFGD